MATPKSIKCPHCGRALKITDQHVNKKITCAACKKKINLVAGPPVPKPPPVPSSAHPWYLHIHGRNVGPYGADTVRDQLKAGKIAPDTLAWKEGMEDWLPVSEVGDLVAEPKLATKAAAKTGAGKPREKRHRYVPGQSRKKDVVLGAWIAIGLGAVALLIILVVSMQPEEEPQSKKKQAPAADPGPPIIIKTRDDSGTKTAAKSRDQKENGGKRLSRKARLSKAQILAEFKDDLDEWFKKAIEAHKAGDPKPIGRLALNCHKWAKELQEGDRDWGVYKKEADLLIERLGQAGDGIKATLMERATGWNLGDGLSREKRAEILELNKFDWLTRWHEHLTEDLERIRKKGLDF